MAAALLTVGCAVPSSDASEPASSGAPSAAGPLCDGVSLRDPAGQPVFLSGRWIGSGDPNALPAPSVFLFRQTNDCLTWVGLSAEDGEALGATWIQTFIGRIRSDYTIVGAWEDVPEGGRGTLTAAIEFVQAGDQYEVEIVLADSSGDSHLTKRWVREDASP